MSDDVNEIYTIHIERRSTEFEVIHFAAPEDDFGKKMLSIMLYQIAENIDPAAGGDGQ
jgi:hypothetical protein